MVSVKHSHDDHHHHQHHAQVVLDEVYKSKKEKSADTLSAESEETQVIFWGKHFGILFGGRLKVETHVVF